MSRPGMMIGKKEFVVEGPMLEVGQAAPDFRLTANNWSVKSLADYTDKLKIFSIVPSLDTRVCAAQTRRFNQEAGEMGESVVVLTVSTDLPYAQQRWCGAEGISVVETLSDHKDVNFGLAYGLLVSELRVLQRAVIILDRQNTVRYVEYVPVMGSEVNFNAALESARAFM
ncbi:MAG: thiol peroxidase [Chloroflexi bacterium]|nr:thiol peroxidase [Chloroflexota bacterium]